MEKDSQNSRARDKTVIASLIKGLHVMELLAESKGGVKISELSKQLDMNKTTVYRLLTTLRKEGYISQDKNSSHYKLTFKIANIANRMINNMDIKNHLRPYLKKIMDFSQEAVQVAILEKGEVVFIEKLDSPQLLSTHFQIGRRSPLHCTGVGKVFLAFLDEKTYISLMGHRALRRYTANTITDSGVLLENLEEVRRLGYAVDNEEHNYGVKCVAAPIRDVSNEVIISVSISGPSQRMDKGRFEEMGRQLIEICNEASRSLGWV